MDVPVKGSLRASGRSNSMRWVRRVGGLFTEEVIEEPEPVESGTIRHVEEEVPNTTRELSPAEKLRSLEEVALALGISQRELDEIRSREAVPSRCRRKSVCSTVGSKRISDRVRGACYRIVKVL